MVEAGRKVAGNSTVPDAQGKVATVTVRDFALTNTYVLAKRQVDQVLLSVLKKWRFPLTARFLEDGTCQDSGRFSGVVWLMKSR
jgi:hypothetical protein